MTKEKIEVRSRGGSVSLVDPTRGKFGLEPGQLIEVRKGVTARVLGVGGWPNQFAMERLWVRENTGDDSIVESPDDVRIIE